MKTFTIIPLIRILVSLLVAAGAAAADQEDDLSSASTSAPHPIPPTWSCPDDVDRGTCPWIMAWCKLDDPVFDDGGLTRGEAFSLLVRFYGGVNRAAWYWCLHRPHDYDTWPVTGDSLFRSSGPQDVVITKARNNTNDAPDWSVWQEIKDRAMKTVEDDTGERGYFLHDDLTVGGPLFPLYEQVVETERMNPSFPWYGWKDMELTRDIGRYSLQGNLEGSICEMGHPVKSDLPVSERKNETTQNRNLFMVPTPRFRTCGDKFLWEVEFEKFLMRSEFPSHVESNLWSVETAGEYARDYMKEIRASGDGWEIETSACFNRFEQDALSKWLLKAANSLGDDASADDVFSSIAQCHAGFEVIGAVPEEQIEKIQSGPADTMEAGVTSGTSVSSGTLCNIILAFVNAFAGTIGIVFSVW